MHRYCQRRIPWTFLFPLILVSLACLVGCQDRREASPTGADTAGTPEAAVLELMAAWRAEGAMPMPIAQVATSTATESTTVVQSLGTIKFQDLSGGQHTFQIIGKKFLSPELAEIYTTYEFTQDPALAGMRADITFVMTLQEGVWRLDDLVFTKLPPVIVVGGLGVQGYIRDTSVTPARPVENAAAALFQGETLIDSTLTDANGFYSLTAPAPGTYTLTVTKDGYEFLTVPNLYLY